MHQTSDGSHQLVGLRVALAGLRAHHAVVGAVVEKAERDLVERGLDRGDLGEYVDAVAVSVTMRWMPPTCPSMRRRRTSS